MKSNKTVYALLICLMAVGCSAPTVFDLNPTDKDFYYQQGRKVVSREDSIATTILNFEYHVGNKFSFYIEITNNSNNSFLIDPSFFFVKILEPSKVEGANRISIVDPEARIEMIQHDISSNEASKDAAIGMNMFFGLFNAVVNIASEAPPEKVIEDIVFWGNNANNEAIEHDIEKEELQTLKKHWINNVLRKTTLSPGEYFRGLFYLPVHPEAKLLKLVFSISNTTHEFIFQQNRMN